MLTCIDFIGNVFLRFFDEAFYLPVFGFVDDNTVFGRLFDSSHLQQVNVVSSVNLSFNYETQKSQN